jgi:hypothetical protein
VLVIGERLYAHSVYSSRFLSVIFKIPSYADFKTYDRDVVCGVTFQKTTDLIRQARGFGGLVVSMLASGTQDREFKPGRSCWIFRVKKSTAYLPQRGSKAVCPMSQICVLLKNPVVYVEVGITGQIDRPFLARNSVLH